MENLSKFIRDIPNFPKEGIVFKDITTLLNNKDAFLSLMEHLEDRYRNSNLDFIVGIESRGFIFGSALATRLGVGFVPIRKKGKLPSKTISKTYSLEYGVDTIGIHNDAFLGKNGNVILIDDLIATGGTAKAACELIKEVGANLVEACFIINLTFLNGQKLLEDTKVYSVLNVD